jgi:hypothetical protein
MAFKNSRGKLLFDSTDRDLDLSDALMLHWPAVSRTVYLGLNTTSKRWSTWTDEAVKKIEWLIRYDLNFDAYTVSIKRLRDLGDSCANEFVWKLNIRPMGWYPRGEKVTESKKRNPKASRYRKARSDASVESIQQTIEEEFGLPQGSVRLINPNGRKIRSDATVGTLVSNWEKNG